MEKILRFTW